MDGEVYMLGGLLLLGALFIGVVVYVDESRASACKEKGGVYVSKINRCMKKEYFIPME